MKSHSNFLIPIFLLLVVVSCQWEKAPDQSSSSQETQATFASYTEPEMSSDFKNYWYQGNAEITSYQLSQARYGELREGNAVLIFVTEDFSKEKQVKLDGAPQAGDERVPILKLNYVKKFNTGIYPYSLMQSIFSPVDLYQYPHAIKTTTTVQEWCGHVFTQINWKKDKYLVNGYSYFESEGDESYSLNVQWMEDELWTRIRIAPEDLPTGSFKMIPSLFYTRLKHKEIKAYEAQAKVMQSESDEQAMTYIIEYPTLSRSLSIHYEKAFPHKILGWEENYSDGYGPGASVLTTSATLQESKQIAYWSKNSNADEYLRTELGLP